MKEELAVTVKQLAAAAAQASVAHARAGRSDVVCASALEAVSDLEAQNKSLRVARSRLRNVVADCEADLERLRDSAQRRRERNHNASRKQNATVLRAFKEGEQHAAARSVIADRKSDAKRAHVTVEGASAMLGVRDRGKIANGRVKDTVEGFDEYKVSLCCRRGRGVARAVRTYRHECAAHQVTTRFLIARCTG